MSYKTNTADPVRGACNTGNSYDTVAIPCAISRDDTPGPCQLPRTALMVNPNIVIIVARFSV